MVMCIRHKVEILTRPYAFQLHTQILTVLAYPRMGMLLVMNDDIIHWERAWGWMAAFGRGRQACQ